MDVVSHHIQASTSSVVGRQVPFWKPATSAQPDAKRSGPECELFNNKY